MRGRPLAALLWLAAAAATPEELTKASDVVYLLGNMPQGLRTEWLGAYEQLGKTKRWRSGLCDGRYIYVNQQDKTKMMCTRGSLSGPICPCTGPQPKAHGPIGLPSEAQASAPQLPGPMTLHDADLMPRAGGSTRQAAIGTLAARVLWARQRACCM